MKDDDVLLSLPLVWLHREGFRRSGHIHDGPPIGITVPVSVSFFQVNKIQGV
jgi:hypothetical protein